MHLSARLLDEILNLKLYVAVFNRNNNETILAKFKAEILHCAT